MQKKYAALAVFSILLMNILTPYIDRLTEIRPLGGKFPEKEGRK